MGQIKHIRRLIASLNGRRVTFHKIPNRFSIENYRTSLREEARRQGIEIKTAMIDGELVVKLLD